ncbi:MAG TPA: large conductance mechanosensitive channel protein MscL [Metabacillus sp.]|nr:large conductance mechanosensitive channel protein MscL [Metabacillus sp.]
MLKEFKEFAMRGNVIDLAVGVVIGAAFGKIVSSLVNDIITPLIGLLMGGINVSDLQFKVGDAAVMYGLFIQTVIDFIIVAFSIFLFVKLINRFKKKEEVKEEATAPTLSKEEELLTDIRDLLRTESQRERG